MCSKCSASGSVLCAGWKVGSPSEILVYLTRCRSPSGGMVSWTLSVCVSRGVEVMQPDRLRPDVSKVLLRHSGTLGGSWGSPESWGGSLVLKRESICVGTNEHRLFSLLLQSCDADLCVVFESFLLQTLGEGLVRDRKGDLGLPWLRMFLLALSNSLPIWTRLGTREFWHAL